MNRPDLRCGAVLVAVIQVVLGFCQGQNMFQSNGFGDQYLLSPAPPLFAFPARSVHIGTSANGFATLRVRGDQLPVNDAFGTSRCTFRTDVIDGFNQNWSMVRNDVEIGRLYHTNPNTSFNIQARQPDGHLWLRNSDGDGLKINFNGTSGGTLFVNGYALDRQAFAGLGEDVAMTTTLTPGGPWSRLHLVHPSQGAAPAYGGYRPWMRNGVLGTGNSDLFYLGHKYAMTGGTGAEQDDNSDMVAAWFDDVLPSGTAQAFNNFSFRYLGNLNVGGSAGTIDGLEMLRLRPYRLNSNDPVQGYVGLGDWVNSGGQLPTERLDILNGRMRHRQLPTDAEMTSANRTMVVDANGIVGWRTWPTITSGTDCDWSPSTGDIATAYAADGTNLSCPEEDNSVLIGYDPTAMPFPVGDSKVWIHTRSGEHPTTMQRGVYVDALSAGESGFTIGVNALAHNGDHSSSVYTYGLLADATNGGTYNHGVEANAYIDGVDNIGLNNAIHGTATVAEGSTAPANYGVLLRTSNTGSVPVYQYGVYSDLRHESASSTWLNMSVAGITRVGATSSVGTNVGVYGWAASSDGAEVVSGNCGVYGEAISVDKNTVCYGVYGTADASADANTGPGGHTRWAGWFDGYTYVGGTTFGPSDEQLKQNIEELPADQAVQKLMALNPKTYDFDQNTPSALQLPYEHQIGLIAQEVEQVLPDLVKNIHKPADVDSTGAVIHPSMDFKALNYQGLIPLLIAGFKAQQATIASLQDQINGCCANIAPVDQRSMSTGSSDLNTERLLIAPNPFTDHTTVQYFVPQPARVSLQVSDSMGKPVSTLREEQAMAGSFTYEWNTQSLTPGTYFVALLVDGNVVVKKAVKVGEH